MNFSGPALAVWAVLTLVITWLYWLVRYLIAHPWALISLAAIVFVVFIATFPAGSNTIKNDTKDHHD